LHNPKIPKSVTFFSPEHPVSLTLGDRININITAVGADELAQPELLIGYVFTSKDLSK
jgi:hypothetical protein